MMREYKSRRTSNLKYKKTEKGKAMARAAAIKYRVANPEKARARDMLNNAIKLGKIDRKPCEVCGDKKAHAHHTDYSQPYTVEWLCRTHHSEEHQYGT